ncbi:MAG: tRNA (N(6)-L-threonylcarbamoyladenosine(37)-C(2))-methylthiotransferase MtaB [Synergistales bacterium]|nr:tRNA (N(6)-L-threonylcarbamoyladenosine(37)-C(2))-methylthiotransferase MtaB [Synergistales bacterium]
MFQPLKELTVWFHTLGCRTNQYESEALASSLVALGARIVEEPELARIAIIQTCTVTSVADRKTRQVIRRVKRKNSSAVIIASGCWAQGVGEEEAFSLGVDILVGSRKKSRIPSMILSFLERQQKMSLRDSDLLRSDEWDPLNLNETHFHTRAFIKIQDGCDHFCSYCIIPYVRGLPVSRDHGQVLREVRHLAENGTREVILTGIHLGLYGKGTDMSLGTLVADLATLPGLERIRFGSLEPFALDEDLLRVLSEIPQFCPHLHLPLQSGDDRILAAMRRGYSFSGYMKMIDMARSFLGTDLHISTDIMIGFPGESEEAFLNTLKAMEVSGFGKVHVFPFSPRKGTPAAGSGDSIDPPEIRDRVHRALEVADSLYTDYCRKWLDRVIPVLIEGSSHFSHGLTPQFLKVVIPQVSPVGSIPDVRITSVGGEDLEGERIN